MNEQLIWNLAPLAIMFTALVNLALAIMESREEKKKNSPEELKQKEAGKDHKNIQDKWKNL